MSGHELAWTVDAACVGIDPECFFGPPGVAVPPEVKRVCRNCPVNEECLDYALRHVVHGVWSGTSETQREQLRRARGIRAVPLMTAVTA